MAYVVSVTPERRNAIAKAMQIAPLMLPYADVEKWRAIPSLEDRYDVAMLVLPPERLKELGLEEDHFPEQVFCRQQAAKYIAQKIQDMGISFRSVSSDLSINQTTFSHYLKGERPVALPFLTYAKLCREILHESAHKVMFGEEGQIVLPAFYSAIVKKFTELDEGQRKEIADRADLLKEFVGNGDESEEAVKTLIRERCAMLLDERGAGLENFFGERMPLRLRHSCMGIFETHKVFSPQLSSVLFIAMQTGMGLDFFICRDFTQFTRCFFRDGQALTEIRDRDALRFIAAIFTVDEESRAKIAAPVVAQMIK